MSASAMVSTADNGSTSTSIAAIAALASSNVPAATAASGSPS